MHRNTLQKKLKEFVDCILEKAARDPAFAAELAAVFEADAGESRVARAGPRRPKSTFNPVVYLKDKGESALQQELATKTDDDLRGILRSQGPRKGKELKKLERPQMLQEIADGARAKLKQGTGVALVGAADDIPPAAAPEESVSHPHSP